MTSLQRSSGNLLADRRFAYAEALAADGDAAAAADLLAQVLELAPRWTAAWMALAAAEQRRGEVDRARAAYATAADLDPDGLFGAKLHCDRLSGRVVAAMPPTYVAALFDDYAPRFDRHLVDTLGYRAPAVIADALRESGAPTRFDHALDLGCGTGLMGAAIRPQVTRLDGVDLSPGMVAEARRSGLYDRLSIGDIVAALADTPPGTFDLALAADVVVYLGPLESLFQGIARVLRPGGVLAFTAQSSDTEAVRLGDDLRFAHSAGYLDHALRAAGFAQPHIASVSTRREAGRDVPGLVAVAAMP